MSLMGMYGEVLRVVAAGAMHARPVEHFGALAVDWGCEPLDNRDALQAAIDWSEATGGCVILGHGVYGFAGSLALRSDCALIGQGSMRTRLQQLAPRDGAGWTDCMVTDPASPHGIVATVLMGFDLDGGWDLKGHSGRDGNWQYDPAEMTQVGIPLVRSVNTEKLGRHGLIDSQHRIWDLRIANVAGTGLKADGRGMTMAGRILAERCAHTGIYWGQFDGFLEAIEPAICGVHGIRFVNASNNRVNGVKAWYIGMCKQPHTGYGVSVEGANTSNLALLNVDTQDTYRGSMYLEGHALQVEGGVDSSGYLWHMGDGIVPEPSGAHYALTLGNLQDSDVRLRVTARTGYRADYARDLPRLLDIASAGARNNRITFRPEHYAGTVAYDAARAVNLRAGNRSQKHFNIVDIANACCEIGSRDGGRGPAEFADASDGVNLAPNKAAGVRRWDYVTGRPLWAAGGAPADPWLDAMGNPVITPT